MKTEPVDTNFKVVSPESLGIIVDRGRDDFDFMDEQSPDSSVDGALDLQTESFGPFANQDEEPKSLLEERKTRTNSPLRQKTALVAVIAVVVIALIVAAALAVSSLWSGMTRPRDTSWVGAPAQSVPDISADISVDNAADLFSARPSASGTAVLTQSRRFH